MPKISVLYPEESRQTAKILESGLLVGRSPLCDLQLTDEFVSGKHCKIFFESKKFFIEDLGSTNGTFIDGTEVKGKSPLEFGQSIQIGITVLKLSP
ncbi:MAG: FHA domain-containing protein [Fibromonadaceae bacterium]|jgi:pSer/pThr/pTyr-binding forkhead associated (FHA) protein|nr:FHA domain-containing protein [Fibromonadaceae bacterium]